ncbi:MAG: sulfite exporter TauE/SafE family protein [Erysipelotrichaceae bacterium]
MLLIYTLIILIATFFGATAGLGGGVIIKPLLDLIGYHSVSEISFFSSVAVFTMSIVAIIKQLKAGVKLDLLKVILIAFGSIVGGLLGSYIFSNLTSSDALTKVQLIQSILLLLIFILILIYSLIKSYLKTYQIKQPFIIFLIGVILGTISVFLGIGGGPINMAVLLLLFSLDLKQATVYSIAIIFFSQLAKLSSVLVNGSYLSYDLTFVPVICLSAIVGGYLGTLVNQKITNRQITIIFVLMMISLILLTLYNIYSIIL